MDVLNKKRGLGPGPRAWALGPGPSTHAAHHPTTKEESYNKRGLLQQKGNPTIREVPYYNTSSQHGCV